MLQAHQLVELAAQGLVRLRSEWLRAAPTFVAKVRRPVPITRSPVAATCNMHMRTSERQLTV